MKRGLEILMFIMALSLSSCFKEKALAPPSSAGIGETQVVTMGPYYTDQYFYSLATNKVISSNSRFAYDLMFDCDASKFNIWLNTAKFTCVVHTGKYDLDAVTIQDTIGHDFYYEVGAFNSDSNAIGQWWETGTNPPASRGEVYIMNLGVDTLGKPFGFVKMIVNDYLAGYYSVTYEDINGGPKNTLVIGKDATRNYRYLTFTNNQGVVDNIEPDKSQWDLCFTHYSVLFYVPYYLPYQVTGVLTNPSRVTAYLDSTVVFDSVKIGNLQQNKLQSNRDVIGYDWKTYTGVYTTKSYYTYFISGGDNRYYKFHFISFNLNGVKGYPSFEFSQL